MQMRGWSRGGSAQKEAQPLPPPHTSPGPSADVWLLLVGGEKDEGREMEGTDWDAI